MTSQNITLNTITKLVFTIIKLVLEIVHIPTILLRQFKKSKKCPPIIDQNLLMSAAEIATKIRTKKIRSKDIVQSYISRIQEVNPILNAIIEERFEAALKEAQEKDDFLKNSNLTEEELKNKYPLLGVPITIKGSIAVTGLRHTTGRKDISTVAQEDAVVVKNARDAGAIPLVISNVPELCLNWESVNKLVGCTVNPYDSKRTSGGSSGGEASLLGAGASLIGIGSDIAGSLRLPAHFCGIWGHKPSPHVVSTIGHYPDCKDVKTWRQVFSLGPMARYATDLKLLLSVIAEPEMKQILKLDEMPDSKRIRVFYFKDLDSNLGDNFGATVQEAVQKVVDHFDKISVHKSTKANVPLMNYCIELAYLRLLNIDGVDSILDGRNSNPYKELIQFLLGQSDYEFMSIMYLFLLRGKKFVPEKLFHKVNEAIVKLRKIFLEILGDDGVLIMPTSPSEAFYNNEVLRTVFNGGYLAIFNSLGFPVTNCPVMFSQNGLPIGIQVIAAPNCDRLTLSVAEEIERTFGGWQFV